MSNLPSTVSNEELAELKKLCSTANGVISGFDGTSASADATVLPFLVELEEWYIRNIQPKEFAISQEVQFAISQTLLGTSRLTIDSVIDDTITHLAKDIRPERSPDEIITDFQTIEHSKMKSVILPTDPRAPLDGEGSGEWEEVYEPRLEMLIQALNRHGIYTDEIYITTGDTNNNVMRKVSYSLIEIPRIWKEILVCNQVGEASRVMQKPLGRHFYSRATKEQLDSYPIVENPIATKLICRDVESWVIEVLQEIDIEEAKSRKRIKLDFYLNLRSKLTAKYSAAQWLALTTEAIENEFDDESLDSIFIQLGLEQSSSDATTREKQVLIASVIFGHGERCVLDALKELEITSLVIDENPNVICTEPMKVEARKDLETEIAEELSKDPSDPLGPIALQWIEIIKSSYPDSESWLRQFNYEIYATGKLPAIDPKELKRGNIVVIHSEKVKSENTPLLEALFQKKQAKYSYKEITQSVQNLGQRFRFSSKPTENLVSLINYTRVIYGDSDPTIARLANELEEERRNCPAPNDSPEEWKNAFKDAIISPQVLIKIINENALHKLFRIGGIPLSELRFKIGVNNAFNSEKKPTLLEWIQEFFNLSLEEAKAIIEENDRKKDLERDKQKLRDKLRKAIKRKVTSAFEWCHLSEVERQELTVNNKGLQNIARVFEIEGNPISDARCFIQLGIQIYGDDLAFKEFEINMFS